jgi:hypothetical protein
VGSHADLAVVDLGPGGVARSERGRSNLVTSSRPAATPDRGGREFGVWCGAGLSGRTDPASGSDDRFEA